MKKILLITGLILLFASCKKDVNQVVEESLTFTTPDSIRSSNHGELAIITITASGGMLPYDYYVVPETQWIAGDMMKDMLTKNDFSRLYRYTYTIPVIEVRPGTSVIPAYYWVAFSDNAENGPISGTNLLSWWKRVAVYDL
jgi:hypothetical protein